MTSSFFDFQNDPQQRSILKCGEYKGIASHRHFDVVTNLFLHENFPLQVAVANHAVEWDGERLLVPDTVTRILNGNMARRYTLIHLRLHDPSYVCRTMENRVVGHANLIFIDNQTRVVDRYEPHGIRSYYNILNRGKSPMTVLDETLAEFFMKYQFAYVPPSWSFVHYGIQNVVQKNTEFRGFCQFWCLLYAIHRLKTGSNSTMAHLALHAEFAEGIKQNTLRDLFLPIDREVYDFCKKLLPNYESVWCKYTTLNTEESEEFKQKHFEEVLLMMELDDHLNGLFGPEPKWIVFKRKNS
jgi:hypothetical protein